MNFYFYYEDKVQNVSTKEDALSLFRAGGFYKAVYYPNNKPLSWFRLIETEEDILSL